MKKHVIGRHLACFVSRKAQLSLEEQMQRYEDLLLSAARDAGCLSLTGLLKLVNRRKWFPKCRSRNHELHKDDQQLTENFSFWLTGQELNQKPNISPPSCTALLLHWRVLGVLLHGNVTRCKDPQPQPKYNSAVWRRHPVHSQQSDNMPPNRQFQLTEPRVCVQSILTTENWTDLHSGYMSSDF